MTITDNLLTSAASRPKKKLSAIKGIIIHYVGNNGSTAIANRNFFNNGTTEVSAHYIVGLQGEVIRCIPDDEIANHAGKSYGTAWIETSKVNNSTTIGIETCHPKADGKFNDTTYASLVELTADLCKKYNLSPAAQVYRHYDRCGKSCPLWYVNNPSEWEKFKKDVLFQLQKRETTKIEEEIEMVDNTKVLFDGKEITVERILKNDTNYIKLRDLEKLGLKVGYDTGKKMR